jgi:hypothetical protein
MPTLHPQVIRSGWSSTGLLITFGTVRRNRDAV